MTVDLRSYLAGLGDRICRPARPLSVVHEITALQHLLGERTLYPPVVIDRPVLADGSISPMPVCTNLAASRTLVADALGIGDHRGAAAAFARLTARPIAPAIVAAGDAPVREIVERDDAVDLTRLPVLRQHPMDAGAYITAGHCTTFDPVGGADNTSIQRCWVTGPRTLTFYPYAGSHNDRNVRAWWARGEACPIAIWVGHHPKIVIGAQAKLGHPESHWAAAGGLAGAPVRLVPSLLHGERLMVPADAEVVIEGWVPPNRLVADGPFGEYPGYMGLQVATPMVEVAAITRRRDAIWHDFGAGLEDHLIADNMAMEGKLYALARSAAPSTVNVHVPYSGRRFHAYLQLRDPPTGETRDALTAALAFRRIRTVIAVDEDVDLFDEGEMLWALATRVQWHRDILPIDGVTHPNLDPSLPPEATTITRMGIDATLPASPAAGLPKPFPPRIAVNAAALAKAQAVLGATPLDGYPRQ